MKNIDDDVYGRSPRRERVKRVRADARENACIFLRDKSRPFYGRARRALAARVVCRSYPGERDARGHEIANDVNSPTM